MNHRLVSVPSGSKSIFKSLKLVIELIEIKKNSIEITKFIEILTLLKLFKRLLLVSYHLKYFTNIRNWKNRSSKTTSTEIDRVQIVDFVDQKVFFVAWRFYSLFRVLETN